MSWASRLRRPDPNLQRRKQLETERRALQTSLSRLDRELEHWNAMLERYREARK